MPKMSLGPPRDDSKAPLFSSWYSKGVFAVLDQATYSFGNFLLNVFLARLLSPSDYGLFALGFAVLLYFQGLQNALVLEPMSILGPSRYRTRLCKYLLAQLNLHYGITVTLGTVLIFLGLLLHYLCQNMSLSALLVIVGVVLPFYGLGRLGRRFFYVLQRPAGALWVSGAHFSVSMWVLFALWYWGQPGVLSGLVIIGIAGGLSGALSIFMVKKMKWGCDNGGADIPFREILYEHWRLGRWLVILAPLGMASQVVVFVPAATMGLAEAGALRALANLILPVQQTVVALSSIALPTLASAFAHENKKIFLKKSYIVIVGLTSLTLVYAVVLLLAAPRIEYLLYEGKYTDYVWVVPILAADAALATLGVTLALVLKSMERTDYAVFAGATSSIVLLLLTAGLAYLYGIYGFLWGMIVSRVIALLLYVRYVRRAFTMGVWVDKKTFGHF